MPRTRRVERVALSTGKGRALLVPSSVGSDEGEREQLGRPEDQAGIVLSGPPSGNSSPRMVWSMPSSSLLAQRRCASVQRTLTRVRGIHLSPLK